MYCLSKDNANMNFVARESFSQKSAPDAIPLVNFVDMDQDGMMDAYFYH